MLSEIIMELNKIGKNTEVTDEKVLCWTKGVEAQRVQSAIMSSLSDTREFDKLKLMKTTPKDSPRRSSTYIKHLQNKHGHIVDLAIPQSNDQSRERTVQTAAKSATSAECMSRRVRAVNEEEQEKPNTVQEKVALTI